MADLKSNEKEMKAAYNDVCNLKSNTNWALFGYVAQTNVLKLVETGDGGLEELVGEFNSGQVLTQIFCICCLRPGNSNHIIGPVCLCACY